MDRKESTRRDFIKQSALGAGTVGLSAVTGKSFLADKKLTVLCIGAHPGDPEFGCGGTLIKYSDAGHSVVVVYLTRGEAFDSSKTYAEAGALRTKEADASCKIMKARPVFADQVDGHSELTKERNAAFTKLILAEKPDIVFTHWPVDSHPDHQVAGIAGLNAWLASGKAFDLYFYEVNTGDETMGFMPTDYVGIEEVRVRKKAALMAHQTQEPEKVYDGWFRAMEDFRGLESQVKSAEGFIHFKSKSRQAILPGL